MLIDEYQAEIDKRDAEIKLHLSDVSHSTLFCVTKRYPRANPNNRYDIDKRIVQLEIETGTPLSDDFYDALTNLLSAYCG